jgi:hypothetical protein
MIGEALTKIGIPADRAKKNNLSLLEKSFISLVTIRQSLVNLLLIINNYTSLIRR